MNKFLQTYIPPKLNKEEIDSLKRPINRTETESVINQLLANRSPGPDSFAEGF